MYYFSFVVEVCEQISHLSYFTNIFFVFNSIIWSNIIGIHHLLSQLAIAYTIYIYIYIFNRHSSPDV